MGENMKVKNNRRFLYLNLIATLSITSSLQTKLQPVTTEDQFLGLLDQSNPVIIMGGMEACPHCKIITPVFENLSDQKECKSVCFYKSNGPAIGMHKHVERESAGKGDFKIPGYPAFVFVKGRKIDSLVVGGQKEQLTEAVQKFCNNQRS